MISTFYFFFFWYLCIEIIIIKYNIVSESDNDSNFLMLIGWKKTDIIHYTSINFCKDVLRFTCLFTSSALSFEREKNCINWLRKSAPILDGNSSIFFFIRIYEFRNEFHVVRSDIEMNIFYYFDELLIREHWNQLNRERLVFSQRENIYSLIKNRYLYICLYRFGVLCLH